MAGRLAVSIVFLSFLIAALAFEPLRWAMVVFIGVAGVLCVQEVRGMFKEHGFRIRKRVAMVGVVALTAEGALLHLDYSIYVLGGITAFAFAHRLRSQVEGAFRDISATIGLVAYVGIPCAIYGSLFAIGKPASPWIALTLAVIFCTDTAALIVGKAMGRHKLAPNVSPGKTIEGSIGGLLGASLAVAVGVTVFPATWSNVSLLELGIFTVVFCAVTQVGDLVESLIKRDAGVKDSGASLGGHGGFLDMLDAVLYSAVPLAIYLHVLHPEVFEGIKPPSLTLFAP